MFNDAALQDCSCKTGQRVFNLHIFIFLAS